MDLSVCVLTHNQPVLLPECVEACLAEIARSRVTGEVIIIDNASKDAYPTRLSRVSPLIRIMRNEENLSFSAANNNAIRSSSGRFVLILNDDAVLQEGSLCTMLRELESSPEVGAVGPKLLNPDGSLQEHFTNRRFPHIRGTVLSLLGMEGRLGKSAVWRDLLTLDRDPDRSGETDHLAGACLLARREALDRVGLFDEGFRYWFEDTDLCCRLKEAGWRIVYLASARVIHRGSASLGRLDEAERSAMFHRSMVFFYKKNKGALRCFLLRLSLVLALLYRALRIVLHNVKAAMWKREDSR